jgi:hypothetical protein
MKFELGVNTDVWREDKPPKGWKGGPLPMTSYQRRILRALVKYKHVSVKSCHGSGKTWFAARAGLYLMFVFKPIGISTAPTGRQVKRLLWSEIHDAYARAPRPLGGKLNQTYLELGNRWFMEGFATDSPEFNISGLHEECMIVIVDETHGVEPQTLDMMDTLLTSHNSYVLWIGNPVIPEGPFYQAFQPGSPFKPEAQITISAGMTPNVRHGRIIYPKLVTQEWVDRQIDKYGEDDPWTIARVHAEFPETNLQLLIAPRAIQRAEQADFWDEKPHLQDTDKVVSLGVDVGRGGGDPSVIGVRWASGRYRTVHRFSKTRTTELSGEIIHVWKQFRPRSVNPEEGPCINIDDTGVGGGVTDILLEQGYPVNGIVSSESPDELYADEDSAEHEDMEQFLNVRAQCYWKLRTRALAGTLDIDETTAYQLTKIQRERTSKDKIKIEEKDKIRKRLRGRSPDEADTCMLAFAADEAGAGEWVRFI